MSEKKENKKPDQEEPKENLLQQVNKIDISKAIDLTKEFMTLEKAMKSSDPATLVAAQKKWNEIQERESSNGKSQLIDPNEFMNGLGYKHKSTSLTYEMLRKMAKTPVIKAIVSTRQTQVSAFSRPQKNKYETGFKISKKTDYFTEEEPEITNKDKKNIRIITEFLMNGGIRSNAWHGDNFKTFLKKITKDSLELDQATFEVVRNKKGDPVEFFATDAATMRIADSFDDDEYKAKDKEEKLGYLPSYVQIIEGQIKAEYYPWELCFGTRNTDTNIYNNGYGTSEVEELINIITYMLYGDSYNGKFFSQGSAPKGMIKVSGNVNRNRLAQFRQQWLSMVAGVTNAWKVPIIESDNMEYIDLQKNNTDMQFAQWQEYLIKIACSIFKIAPEEIGFSLSNAGGSSSLFESSNEQELKYSRDKGLKPLLTDIEFWINKYIIQALSEDYEFKFVGIDAETEEKELDLNIKKITNFMGYKEIRKMYNLPEELDEDDLILNPVYMQMKSQQAFAGDQEESTQAAEDSEGEADFEWNSLDEDDEEVEKGEESKPFWDTED